MIAAAPIQTGLILPLFGQIFTIYIVILIGAVMIAVIHNAMQIRRRTDGIARRLLDALEDPEAVERSDPDTEAASRVSDAR